MQDNKELELQYIVDSINKLNKNESIAPDSKLKINEKVRLIEPKTILKKTKYNDAPNYYIIKDISSKSIIINAADGSVKTVTRSQVIPIDASTKIKEAKSAGGNVSPRSWSIILRMTPIN
jgi:hypothetical protein